MNFLCSWVKLYIVLFPVVHASDPSTKHADNNDHIVDDKVLKFRMEVPFEVPTHLLGQGFLILSNMEVRQYLPAEDIYVKSIEFIGVTVNSEPVPFHLDVYKDEEHDQFRDDVPYIYHHTNLHTGQQGIAVERSSIHVNGAIAPGTHPKKTSYEPYGFRFRPDTYLFQCLNVYNLTPKTETYFVAWDVEYQLVVQSSEEAKKIGSIRVEDTKPLVAAMMKHKRLPVHSEIGMDYVLTDTVRVTQDVLMVSLLLHKHPWNHKTEFFDENGVSFYSYGNIPGDGEKLHWIDPFVIKKDHYFTVVINANASFKSDLRTPVVITLMFVRQDGYDRIESRDGLLDYTLDVECLNCYDTGE